MFHCRVPDRADATYEEVEALKERLAEKHNSVHSGSARIRPTPNARNRKRPPPGATGEGADRQDVLEPEGSGGPGAGWPSGEVVPALVIAAELAYQQNADVFGTVEDLGAHKAKLAELEAKRKELYARFPSTWAHGDLHIGRITSDGAALITFKLAPGEVPVHPPETAGERLVEYLLRKEHETQAQAA